MAWQGSIQGADVGVKLGDKQTLDIKFLNSLGGRTRLYSFSNNSSNSPKISLLTASLNQPNSPPQGMFLTSFLQTSRTTILLILHVALNTARTLAISPLSCLVLSHTRNLALEIQ